MEIETKQQVGYSYSAGPAPPSYPASYSSQLALVPVGPPSSTVAFAAAPLPSVATVDPLPTPSDTSNSASPCESGEELEKAPHGNDPACHNIFRPVDFDRYSSTHESSAGECLGYYPLTPTDSEGDGSPAHTGGITAQLVDKELWESFREIGNEMIVTKPGRRLFPSAMVTLRGLAPKTEYTVYMRIASADRFRYKFLGARWVAMGESEVMQNEDRQITRHPSSPNLGSFWMKKPISFKSVKITHNTTSKQANLLLHTMHKYVIEVVVQPAQTEFSAAFTIPVSDTAFVAVTSYQNTRLTQLKIDNNPFAKGFRDRENAIPLGLSPYPMSPLWQMPHITSSLHFPAIGPLPAHHPNSPVLPPLSQPQTSVLPPLSQPHASILPPLSQPHASILPPLSQPHASTLSPLYSIAPPLSNPNPSIYAPLSLPNPSVFPPLPPPLSSVLPPLSHATTPAILPPLSHFAIVPPLSRDSNSPDSEGSPSTSPALSPYPLPLPVRASSAYPRPLPSYHYPWGPWSYGHTPNTPHPGDGYTTDCSED